MKIKCYGIVEEGKDAIAQYANPSQKSFLDYELKQEIQKMFTDSNLGKISYEKTSNGVWYWKVFNLDSNSPQGHLTLLSEDAASMPLATSLMAKGNQFWAKSKIPEKIRMKLGEMIRMCNANDSKFDKLNSNVTELEGIMKSNVSRIVDNMSDLGQVQRKSEIMSSLSMQLEKDSRELEKKMKKRKLIIKLAIFGLLAFFILVAVYMIF